jgi:hypothetical protein
MNERSIDEDQVRAEHEAQVDQRRQWAYLAGVLGGGTIVMVVLIALLGAGQG